MISLNQEYSVGPILWDGILKNFHCDRNI